MMAVTAKMAFQVVQEECGRNEAGCVTYDRACAVCGVERRGIWSHMIAHRPPWCNSLILL